MRALCLFILAGAAWAQIDPDTITITARNSQAQSDPETVSYSATVTAAMEKGLDEVLKAVAAAGVTERDLTDVSWLSQYVRPCVPSGRGCSPALGWSFRFSSPIARFSQTVKALTQVPPTGMSVSYSASSGSGSATPECAYPTLISQARRHAESIATAAGLRVGRITALSDAPEGPAPTFAFFSLLLGIPATRAGIVYDPAPIAPSPSCGVLVQFQLLR